MHLMATQYCKYLLFGAQYLVFDAWYLIFLFHIWNLVFGICNGTVSQLDGMNGNNGAGRHERRGDSEGA